MKFGSRLLLLTLLVGMTVISPASYARQTGPDAPPLVYSSYVGGPKLEGVSDLAVAPDGTIIIAVTTSAPDTTVMRLSADAKQVLGQRTVTRAATNAIA